jgi:hypothetical protein
MAVTVQAESDMNKAHIKLLKENYEKACEEILKAFCDTYEMPYDTYSWVAGDVGTIACVGDYFIDLQDMIYMLDNKIPFAEYEQWSDYCIKASEYGFDSINLQSWHKGAPRVTQETFDKLDALKQELNDAIEKEKNKF